MGSDTDGDASHPLFQSDLRLLSFTHRLEELEVLEIRGAVVETLVLDRIVPNGLYGEVFGLARIVGPLPETPHTLTLAMTQFQ